MSHDGGGNVSELNIIRTVISALLNAFPSSRVGVGVIRSARK